MIESKTNRLFDDNIMPADLLTVVYCLFDCNGSCIYVGQTSSLKNRIYHHLSTGKKFEKFTFIECDPEEANNLEALTIVEQQPTLNKNLPTNDYFVSTIALRNLINTKMNELDDSIPTEFFCIESKKKNRYVKKEIFKKIISAVETAIEDCRQ